MSTFFTGKGDEGKTGLLGSERVGKTDLRIETNGALDETNAALGMARSVIKDQEVNEILLTIQKDIMTIMTEVAVNDPSKNPILKDFVGITQQNIDWLEKQVDEISEKVEPITSFIIPGDTVESALMNFSRTVIRRAERRVVGLYEHDLITNPLVRKYLNRLSTVLFILMVKYLK